MLPSGRTTGDDVESSMTRPEPGRLSVGSTPVLAPFVHPPAAPLAGVELIPGRCEPQWIAGATALGPGGNGRSCSSNAPVQKSLGAGPFGISDANVVLVTVPSAPMRTSHAPRASP